MKNRAFTMIEIIIVVVIMGILAGVAIPKIIGPKDNIISSEGQHTLTVLLGAQKRYQLENSAYSSVLANLDVTIPASQYFDNPVAVDGTGGIVATVASKTANTGLTYTLSINATTGVITCAGASCDTIKCNKGGGGDQCNQ